MSEHTSNTTSGPDGEEWERAVGAARTLLSSDCGWLELFTRAILEEKGVPYGKGLPNPEAPHIPEDKEIEEETMPGQGEPTPTAPVMPAGRHAAEPIRSGIPADAGETGNGYENPPEDATDRDDTPPKDDAEESDTRILPAQEGKTDLGRDESGDLDPARARDVSGQFGARMRRSETYYPNLAAFVERFVANVFCYHQSASVNMQWVSDWWRYPALVFPLDAMWRAYENARKAPGQMMIFYIQAASMLDRVFDKDRGIVASLDCKQNLTRKGEPLPCERPNRAWREPILETLSVPAAGGKENKETTWTRKISCYLCCFFGGCHWLPRRMKYQERPYNRTPLHSREAGRDQTKTPQHIPFRLFYSQVPFQMHFKVPKKRHTYRSDRFCRINCHALSFLHRGGFVSRRCICSFNGDDARAPWPCNPPRIGRPCRR